MHVQNFKDDERTAVFIKPESGLSISEGKTGGNLHQIREKNRRFKETQK